MLHSLYFSRLNQAKVLYGENKLFDNEMGHTFNIELMLPVISGTSITMLV